MSGKYETELTKALRQYRHNDDNSPDRFSPEQGFVFAYDKAEVDRLVASLAAERDALAAHVDSVIYPSTLAGLKAEWQAEALENAANGFEAMTGPASYIAALALRKSADELRRQSQEAT